ncbi:MAG: septum formation family protein [Actinomycetaceae bacterium]|nr:septum formation family protein [Actinomycetaceae bacterium]
MSSHRTGSVIATVLMTATAVAGCNHQLAATSLKVGDCIASPQGEEIRNVEPIDCAQPHGAEIYYVHTVEGQDFPGDEVLNGEAQRICAEQFAAYVGVPVEQHDTLTTWFMTPTQESWSAGDHIIVCLAVNTDLTPLTGTVKGSAS